MRHAKSSWDNPDLSDFERPLNDRGRIAAPFMGELMKREGFEPYVILASPAARARNTAEMVKEAGDLAAQIGFDERIYEASTNTLRQIASEIDDLYSSALFVGHNPGTEGFVRYLTGEIEPMPTAALAVIDLDIRYWNSINEGTGKIRKIFRPKMEMKKEA